MKHNFDISRILDFDRTPELSLDQVNQARKQFDYFDKTWIGQEPEIYSSVTQISLTHKRFVVDIKSIWYECLFIPKNDSDVLFVSLSGGGRTAEKRYPKFVRWKYANKLNGNMLCIDDPMYKDNDYKSVRWYYGTKNTSYLKEMVSIIKHISGLLCIPYKNIFFIGSSGGGYAANYMANIMDGTNAISMNPQFVLKNWRNGNSNKEFIKNYGIDLSDDDGIHHRNSFVVTAKNSVFMEFVNVQSSPDFEGQFLPFCALNDIKPQYGLTASKNVITWVHCTNSFSPHGANPTELGLFLSVNIIRHFRKYQDVQDFFNLSLLLNEELRAKYAVHLKLAYTSYWRKKLDSLSYTLPNEIIQSYNLSENTVRFVFKSFVHKKNIFYVLCRKQLSEGEEGVDKASESFVYGLFINEPKLATDKNNIRFMGNMAEKYSMKLGKNERSIKLRAECRNLKIAVSKLKKLIDETSELVQSFFDK